MKLGRIGQESGTSGRPKLLVSANAAWNITNFRAGLIAALTADGHKIAIAAPGADASMAAQWGAKAIDLPIHRSGLNPLREARLILRYRSLMRRIRPDAFLSFTPKPNIYGSFAASLCGVPAFPNVSGLGTAFIKPGLLSAFVGRLYRIAFRKCPIVFFQNPDDAGLFIGRKMVTREQVQMLPGSGVDLDHFSPARPSTGTRFLFIGRLLGDKGVREFVEAAAILRQSYPEWKFQLLGSLDEGNRSAIGQSELDRWLDHGIVEYLGQADDVRPHIANTTAVVLPSYREGLPRSLLEAAAMARPLIATDVPGNRQIVRNGENGLLCAVRDASALALAMEKLGKMSIGDREAMGRAGRALVEREFGQSIVIEAYRKALAQLCAQGRS